MCKLRFVKEDGFTSGVIPDVCCSHSEAYSNILHVETAHTTGGVKLFKVAVIMVINLGNWKLSWCVRCLNSLHGKKANTKK